MLAPLLAWRAGANKPRVKSQPRNKGNNPGPINYHIKLYTHLSTCLEVIQINQLALSFRSSNPDTPSKQILKVEQRWPKQLK